MKSLLTALTLIVAGCGTKPVSQSPPPQETPQNAPHTLKTESNEDERAIKHYIRAGVMVEPFLIKKLGIDGSGRTFYRVKWEGAAPIGNGYGIQSARLFLLDHKVVHMDLVPLDP